MAALLEYGAVSQGEARMTRRLWITTALMLALTATPAAADSLPSVDSGARPGPDVLYAPAPDAPQLQNTGVWKAAPILVSGAEAYREGEFLYQDFLFDDHGGTASTEDPNDPFNQVENMFSPKHGTLSYPTDTATYANNAADLVELRVKPLPDATAFRVTLNTLKAADKTAFTIAIGDSAAPVPWPHGAGVVSPAQRFLTVHGNSAELRGAARPGSRQGGRAPADGVGRHDAPPDRRARAAYGLGPRHADRRHGRRR